MKTFKELCDGKMWRAVEAMIVGLETQSKREDFHVNMTTFGTVACKSSFGTFKAEEYHSKTNTVCFGCAATCAVQQLTGINFYTHHTVDKIIQRAELVSTSYNDLNDFETAIDDLRESDLLMLSQYMGVDIDVISVKLYNQLPVLESNNWRDGLPKYKVLLRYLKWRNI